MSQIIDKRLQSLGRPGITGLGLLVFCAVMYASWLGPLHDDLQRQQAAVRQRLDGNPQSTAASAIPPVGPAIESLLTELPVEAQLGEQVQEIHAIAVRHGVTLRKGGYDLVWETAGRLGRQRMVLHSDASYRAIRAFLRDVLAAKPALALDDLSFTRRQPGDSALETTLTLTLLVTRSSERQ